MLAGCTYDAQVFRRIPDELEEAVVVGLFKNDNRGLIDLAADADDAASDKRGRVTHGNGLRIRARAGRVCRLGWRACSRGTRG